MARKPVQHWLMKTEEDSYSIHDLERDGATCWDGVRNYEARNSMDAMRVGDKVLVYHTNAEPSGAAGTATVVRTAYVDATAFDRKDHHFDPKSDPTNPRWRMVDVAHASTFARKVPLAELKADPNLAGMMLLAGNRMRLSIQPLEKVHFDHIVKLGGRKT